MDPWQTVVHVYRQGLSEKEKKLFAGASPQDILQDVEQQEAAQRKASKTRRLAHRIQPLLASIELYGRALDVISNTSALVLAPLWGSIRVLLRVCRFPPGCAGRASTDVKA